MGGLLASNRTGGVEREKAIRGPFGLANFGLKVRIERADSSSLGPLPISAAESSDPRWREEHLVERLLEIIRANPVQAVALGVFILVVVLAWVIESSVWRTRHR